MDFQLRHRSKDVSHELIIVLSDSDEISTNIGHIIFDLNHFTVSLEVFIQLFFKAWFFFLEFVCQSFAGE